MKITVDKEVLRQAVYAALDAQREAAEAVVVCRGKDKELGEARRALWDIIEGAPEAPETDGVEP